MNDYLIYLCLPPYLAQWYAHECNQVHNRDKATCPREIYRFPTPVVPVRGSQESVAYIRTFNVLIFFTTVFIGAFLHSSADHPLQNYVGRALQGFRTLRVPSLPISIPNATQKTPFFTLIFAKNRDFREKIHFFCIFLKTVQSNWTLIC